MGKIMIIAEAGINHNGDIGTAFKMVDAAREAGADAVKFQIYKTKDMIVRTAKKAKYQRSGTGDSESQYDMLKKYALKKKDFAALYDYCRDEDIIFMASAFDLDSIEFLHELGVDICKIPSGEITNYFYLKKIASWNKKILLSTGMSAMREIKDALTVLETESKNEPDITLLHCVSVYPVPMEAVNLKVLYTLKEAFHKKVGLSDHSLGMETAIAAAALGASVIEKHFTLDKKMEGPDHGMSLDKKELGDLVRAVRNVETAMGNGEKIPTKEELENCRYVRKSLVALKNIKKGEVFTVDNLGAKRPGDGISPMKIKELLGKRANRDFKEDEMIKE